MLKKVMAVTKKVIWFGVCLCVLACGWSTKVWMDQGQVSQPVPSEKTARIVPTGADFGSFLAGLTARENQDIARAADYYAKVYAADPDNVSIRWDLYLLSGFSGRTDDFVRLAGDMASMRPSYFAPLVLAADSLKQGDYEKTLALTADKKRGSEMDKLLFPVLRAWGYAGLNQDKQAYKALKRLTEEKGFEQIYYYHKALLAAYFKQPETADKAFTEMASGEMPTVTALQAMRWFYLSQNKWNNENPLFKRYYQTIQNNPALAEVLIARAGEFKLDTPADGAAEAFFMVSTIAGNQEESPETGLLFNTVALLLNSDSDVYKIWGAEQFENMKYYAEANRLYESISHPSDTILVKRALNLMLMNENTAAEQILKEVAARQKNDVIVQSMLANLYRDTNQSEKAVKQYSHVINILKEKGDSRTLAYTYFSRAMAHERLGDARARNADLRAALALNPEDALVLNYLGYVLLEENQNISEAMGYVTAAHHLRPKDAHIWDSLALGYYRQGAYEKALEFAEKAADEIPYSAIVQTHLGDVYAALGRQREAGYQYHKALELKADMSDELKAELQEKLKK